MFLFKNKKKTKSKQDIPNQDSASNDIYVQDDHLLNIKLPDDFSSIILPQLIGYDQDEDGNTINSSTIILRQKQQQQQQQQQQQPPTQSEGDHHHPTREGWYPATRLVGSESNRGTLVDTTNITAASLVQVNKRRSASASLSSSSADTLTYRSKEDSSGGSLDLDDDSSFSHSEKPDQSSSCIIYLQKDRPKFKRNHPRFTAFQEPNEKITVYEEESVNLNRRSFTSSGIKPPTPFISPEPSVEELNTQPQNSFTTNIPLKKSNKGTNDTKVKSTVPGDNKKRTTGMKQSNEASSSKLRQHHSQKKRTSIIMPPIVQVDDTGSMIPRRPLSCSSYTSHTEKQTATFISTKTTKNKQTRSLNIDNNNNNNAIGGGSRIPIRSQTMKV